MYQFKHEFRTLRNSDGHGWFLRLPTGDKPIICQFPTEEGTVDIVLSGSGLSETLITLINEEGTYFTVIPGYNNIHILVADAILDELEAGNDDLQKTIADIVSDYNLLPDCLED